MLIESKRKETQCLQQCYRNEQIFTKLNYQSIIVDFFGPPPFLLVDGSPNGQLLTIYRATSLTAYSYLNLFRVHRDSKIIFVKYLLWNLNWVILTTDRYFSRWKTSTTRETNKVDLGKSQPRKLIHQCSSSTILVFLMHFSNRKLYKKINFFQEFGWSRPSKPQLLKAPPLGPTFIGNKM